MEGDARRRRDHAADARESRIHVDRVADRRRDHRDHRRDGDPRPAAGSYGGNEASAVGSLRTVSAGQTGFAASCGGGFFAPSLAVLSAPPTVIGGEGFISNDLSADPSTKSSYSIAVTPGAPSPVSPASCNGAGAGTLATTYYVGADPVGSGGIRFFGMNQGGTIYWSTAVIPVTQFGAPAGAQPVQ